MREIRWEKDIVPEPLSTVSLSARSLGFRECAAPTLWPVSVEPVEMLPLPKEARINI